MESKNIMITGHKGLIGNHLKKRLENEGYNLEVCIDNEEGFNVTDLLFKEYEVTKPIDICFHFAAACRINECIHNPIIPHRNNVDGILSVLEFCRKNKIPKIVYASSSRVLSKERNPYVASKIYGEEMCKAYSDCYGLEYIIIRPSTVYGPHVDFTSRLINNWLTAAFKNEELKLYGDKTKTLDFTYIDDFIDGVMLTLKAPCNKSYNISGKNETNLYKLAEEIVRQTESKSSINLYDEEKAQPQKVSVDIGDMQDIGFKPKVKIEEGVTKMVQWYKKHPDAWKDYEDKGAEYYGK